MDKVENIFPDYFSDEALNIIYQNGKDNSNLLVYRVGKYGKNNREAFLNYYDEAILGLKQIPKRKLESTLERYKKDVDSLSVSCYYDIKDIEYYYSITLKETHPERILLKGKTLGKFGLSQITSKRKPYKKDSHTDWWLYKDSVPWTVFEKVEL